jgi:hypothetical protein
VQGQELPVDPAAPSAREALSDRLRQGQLDSATAQRLEAILDRPVSRPSEIPEDLRERIPGMDPECLARLEDLPVSARGDLDPWLGQACAEIVEPYLSDAPPAASGEVSVSSSSLLDESPGWQRTLRGSQALGPSLTSLSWSPDRPSPWLLRRTDVQGDGWKVRIGDLPGWSEAAPLWNRPLRPYASGSFLDGSGASMNGAEADVTASVLDLRFAVHRRGPVTAAAAGIGAFGQDLSFVRGTDTGGTWTGLSLRSTAMLDDVRAVLQPSFSLRDSLWNGSARFDLSDSRAALPWRSWFLWQRSDFLQPLAAEPAATGPLKPLPGMDWNSGGFALGRESQGSTWHGSFVASGRGDGAACILPSAGLAQRSGPLSLEEELRWWRLYPAFETARDGGSARQSARWTFPELTPGLQLDESSDTAGWSASATPSLVWKPFPTWESGLRVRQYLSNLPRRETTVSTTLHPARYASLGTELVCRQGSVSPGEERWYFRLEASSRW